MGESFGAFHIGEDDAVLPSVTSISVACGFHGGDPRVINRTVQEAARRGVAIGAHPSFPDLVGFGRRDMKLSTDEVRTDVLYQIGAIYAFTRCAGVPLRHVKPHGQLNNLAVVDQELAGAISAAIQAFDHDLILIAPGGELARAAEAAGLAVGYEVFADRAYNADGSLVSRRQPGAVIHDVEQIVARTLSMVQDQCVRAITGETVDVRADTICVHGDTPGAASIAAALHSGLTAAGIVVSPLREVVQDRERKGG